MDARQPAPPPFQRPPDRHMMHNPTHQPPPQPHDGYPPPTSQPQQPLHVPFSPDPYAASRRDPFLPTSAHHARHNSQGSHGRENAPPVQAERQGGWIHTGTEHILVLSQTLESYSARMATLSRLLRLGWPRCRHWRVTWRDRCGNIRSDRSFPAPRCLHDTSTAEALGYAPRWDHAALAVHRPLRQGSDVVGIFCCLQQKAARDVENIGQFCRTCPPSVVVAAGVVRRLVAGSRFYDAFLHMWLASRAG